MRAIVTCERPLSTSWGRIVAPSNSRPMGAYTSTSIAWSTGVFSAADPLSSVTGAILAVLEGSGKVRFGCGGAGQSVVWATSTSQGAWWVTVAATLPRMKWAWLVRPRLPTTMTSAATDRKSVVKGKGVSVRVDLGGRRILKKKTKKNTSL